MIALFREVPIGQRFEFYGVAYKKTALSMAVDPKEWGNIFLDETVVQVAHGVPLFQKQPRKISHSAASFLAFITTRI